MVGFKRPGEVVHVQAVHAGGQVRTFDVRLVAVEPDSTSVASAGVSREKSARPVEEASSKLGITVESLSADDVRHVATDLRGPVVTDVDADGPAYQRIYPPTPGGGADVILQVNGTRVRTLEEFQRAVHGLQSGQIVTLFVANVSGDGTSARRPVRIRVR
jgi:hypothetical protein